MKMFWRRLSQYVEVSDDMIEAFDNLGGRTRSFKAGEDIIQAGDKADYVFVILEGWAVRYRLLEDGRRQIVNFMLPGDVFDLQALADLKADHSVTTLTAVKASMLDSNDFLNALRQSGHLASAFWWAAVQEESILREQIVRVGRRSARERIGHLLLELQRRLSMANGNEIEDIALPLTRTDIADALGLTPVHVSRTMSAMRRADLISETRETIHIVNPERLSKLCMFDADYLHLKQLSLVASRQQDDGSERQRVNTG